MQLSFCTVPETTISRYFMLWTASYVSFPPSLSRVMSISSWSLDWISGCVASWCAAKHRSVEAVSKPARKKSTTCAAISSSSHSVLRTWDSNSKVHVDYEKHRKCRKEGIWSKGARMNASYGLRMGKLWQWEKSEEVVKVAGLRFSQQCCWGFRSSGMWRCADWEVPDVFKALWLIK